MIFPVALFISFYVSHGLILGPLLSVIYVNDMPKPVNSILLLYAVDSCSMFQPKDIEEIEKTKTLSWYNRKW